MCVAGGRYDRTNHGGHMVDKFLSRQQAADALSVSTQTIDRLIKTGRLRAGKIGPRVVIPEESLRQYVESITDSPILKEEER